MTPKISVIMPIYNEEQFVRLAIESILNQTFSEFEFIIIDDGSTDNTIDAIESFDDPRIILYKSHKRGIAEQLNFGIQKSRSHLIARMDGDDISIQERLEYQYNLLKEKNDISIVGTNIKYVNENGMVFSEMKYPEHNEDIEFQMPIESAVCHPVTVIRKEVFEKYGLYDNKFNYAEDHELFLRFIFKGVKFYNIQLPLFLYRAPIFRTDRNNIARQNLLSYKLGLEYLQKRYQSKNSKIDNYKFYYSMGLLEYYRGDISTSRKYFINALSFVKSKKIKLIRYIIVSFLGNRIINFLRDKNILPMFSLIVKRLTGKDFHSVSLK